MDKEQKETIDKIYEIFEEQVAPKEIMASHDQLNIIDFLLMSYTGDDEEKASIEADLKSLTYDEAEELIEKLQNNQLDKLDRPGYNQTDFAKSNKSF